MRYCCAIYVSFPSVMQCNPGSGGRSVSLVFDHHCLRSTAVVRYPLSTFLPRDVLPPHLASTADLGLVSRELRGCPLVRDMEAPCVNGFYARRTPETSG